MVGSGHGHGRDRRRDHGQRARPKGQGKAPGEIARTPLYHDQICFQVWIKKYPTAIISPFQMDIVVVFIM